MVLVGAYVAQCIKVRLVNRLIFLDWILAFVCFFLRRFLFSIVVCPTYAVYLFFFLLISAYSFHLYFVIHQFYFFDVFVYFFLSYVPQNEETKKILKLIRNNKNLTTKYLKKFIRLLCPWNQQSVWHTDPDHMLIFHPHCYHILRS